MDTQLKEKILSILKANRTMTVATLRPDGWPQATTVGYANEGLTLYFLCGLDSQKAHNLARDNRLSLTIDDHAEFVMQITGVSMAARATPVEGHDEGKRVMGLLMERYPEQKMFDLALPEPEAVRLFKVEPEVISVLDYSKGFGHTELVTC